MGRWRLLWSSCRPGQLLVLPGQMAFTLILPWTRLIACPTWTYGWRLFWSSCRTLIACPTWTDGVYSDPPVDKINCFSYLGKWHLNGIFPGNRISCLSYLDRWRLLCFSCGPSQLFLQPEQMALLTCVSYLDRWRLLWSSCGPGQLPSFWSSPAQQLWSFHRQT